MIPYFGYARQDRKAKARDPISAKLVANMITAAGADRVLTMDLHASQIQGFFDIPVDNLLGNPIFVDYYAKKFGSECEDMMVVSPDVGSVARARAFAQKLHMSLAIVDKRRQKANQLRGHERHRRRAGTRTASSSTTWWTPAGSLCNAAKALVEVGGANERLCLRLPRRALRPRYGPDREAASSTELALLDTIPAHPERSQRSKIKYLQRGPHVRRGHRAHLSGDFHLQAVPLRAELRAIIRSYGRQGGEADLFPFPWLYVSKQGVIFHDF